MAQRDKLVARRRENSQEKRANKNIRTLLVTVFIKAENGNGATSNRFFKVKSAVEFAHGHDELGKAVKKV
jgi:hypothetical protein